ncbi:sulfite exporter TauE/SafE family protein [Corallincola platygyrae]|uniref:Probable membrane transporter protein n=1 Tax=Corallincola platygyrae TaxID=1193278 RepID=A0ABW4XKW1_9GAMM
MIEWWVWLVGGVMVLAGCWLQSALGFGLAIVAAPILVLVHPEWVPVLLTVVAFPLSLINVWQLRRHIEVKTMMVPIVARLPGTALGAWLLTIMSVKLLQISVSVAVLMAVVISLWSKKFESTPSRLAWAGLVSGFMGTTTSVGGPPLALVMQHGDPRIIRANLSLYFLFGCCISMFAYAVTGLMTAELFWQSSLFVPLAVLGVALGTKSRSYIDAGRFRPLLIGLCGTAGTIALIGALWR